MMISKRNPSIALLVLIAACLTSKFTYAETITEQLDNSNISDITVTAPSEWSVHNTNLLFDGITDRYTPLRFAGYQNGGDVLSDTNLFTISVSLNNSVNVSGLAFYNDWRHFLGQQVDGMQITMFGGNSAPIWSQDFTGLQQYSWDRIDLVSFNNPILDVNQIDFTVNKSQGNHFEIRELIVETTFESLSNFVSNQVSAPATALIAFAGLAMVFAFRKRG